MLSLCKTKADNHGIESSFIKSKNRIKLKLQKKKLCQTPKLQITFFSFRC